jgi:hypothetical protein
MSARDLDLALGAILMVFATLLARSSDPALAMIVLALSLSTLVLWLGEDRIEALWRAYTAPPPPPRVRAPRPERPIKMYRRPIGPVRAEPLARARLLTRGR